MTQKKTPPKEPKLTPEQRQALDRLTPNQRAFVLAFRETGNGAEAYRRAGYKGKSPNCGASELRTNPNIQNALQTLSLPAENRMIASADEVLQKITDLMFNAEKEETQLQAAITMAKRYALLTERKEIDLGDNTARTLAAIFARAARAIRGGDGRNPPALP